MAVEKVKNPQRKKKSFMMMRDLGVGEKQIESLESIIEKWGLHCWNTEKIEAILMEG